MSSLVIQSPGDLDPVDRVEVAHPDKWLVDEDWRWVGFEFGGAR